MESPQGELAPVFSTDLARPRILRWLFLALPMFGQTFHYMQGLLPLWALSKAFPVLSLPLVFRLMSRQRFPMTRQILLSFAWLLLVPSFNAVFYFHEGFFTSVTAQVKILPFLYFFSFLAVLLTLQPTLNELKRSFIVMGIAIVVVLIILWAVVPNQWYETSYTNGPTPLFTSDNRGHRIRMSMYFPIVMLFFCYRRAWFERSWRYLLSALIVFAVTALIVKTRAMVIGICGIVAINTIVWARPQTKVLALIIAPLAAGALFSVGYLASIFDTGVGSGLDVRLTTMRDAVGFLGGSPLRWFLGVGTISPTSSDSLMTYFNHYFFLGDITWLGIIFEYGIFGALLFVLIQVRGLIFYRHLRAEVEDDFLGSLADYILYVLLISPFYPPTLTPGESAVILAIFVYVWHAGGFERNAVGLRNSHVPYQAP